MEIQAYHIQVLLANKLDKCKGKENTYTDNHIREIQDVYQNESQEAETLKTINKGKQWENQVQDKEVFLYYPL